jgi:hypothetical protein
MWAAVSSLASLGHDVVAMVRDVQAASRRLPSGTILELSYPLVMDRSQTP